MLVNEKWMIRTAPPCLQQRGLLTHTSAYWVGCDQGRSLPISHLSYNSIGREEQALRLQGQESSPCSPAPNCNTLKRRPCTSPGQQNRAGPVIFMSCILILFIPHPFISAICLCSPPVPIKFKRKKSERKENSSWRCGVTQCVMQQIPLSMYLYIEVFIVKSLVYFKSSHFQYTINADPLLELLLVILLLPCVVEIL